MTVAQEILPGVHAAPRRRPLLVFCLLGCAAFALLLLNIVIGSVSYSPAELLQALMHADTTSVAGAILWKIRIPRAIAALLGGAYLAASGLLLQVYFRNPIVGPFVLGISWGATLMVSFVMLTTVTVGMTVLSPFITTLAAFVGSYGVMLIVVAVASRVRSSITLLIVGLMMGYLCHAVVSILTALAEKEKIKGFVLWQLGSFSGFRWNEIAILLGCGGVVLFGVFLLAKPLNAFLLGEQYAASMGVHVRRSRVLILLCACALAGMITSVAGPVAFVGLAVPHMARLSFGTSDNRILVAGVCLMGAVVTSLCDLVARMALAPVELPLSAITAFFGAPIVIGLLIKRRVEL
jgi:iron complex transport system permease protein